MHTKPPRLTLTILFPILLLLTISTTVTPAPPSSHPTTTTTTTTSTSQPHPPTPTLQQPPPQPPLPKSCRTCLQNNTLGLTCYKNTLCIPLSLLCTTALPSSNPCPDLPFVQLPGAGGTTNPTTPEPGSVLCNPDTNLCQDPTFLPLPAPGVGNIRRDTSSSSSCLKGAFYSLYPSSSTGVGGAGSSGSGSEAVQQKYIQSCIVSTPPPSNSNNNNNNNAGGQPPCQAWEYQVGNSCLLRLCGGPPSSQELSCVLPYTCRKPTPSPTSPDTSTSFYGVCSNSTRQNPDDVDPSASPSNTPTTPPSSRSKKDLLLFNLLIALCSLVGLTALSILLHHLRKRHLQRQGRYLPWTRQDKVHFLQALICRREMGKLWEERKERLKVLQERELKWKPSTVGGGQRRGEGSSSQESVAMYALHSGTITSTQSRSTRALPQQSSSSSIPLPSASTTTATTVTTTTPPAATPTHLTIPPPTHLVPSTTSSSPDNNLRPISYTDSESTDTSSSSQAIMMTHQSRRHRSVLDIFARRWQHQQLQLQQQQQQRLQDGQQQGNSRVREEVEPPPLYHQGSDLPAYRVRSPEPVQEPTPHGQEHE
ncbi:hypothetical protein BKA57DRAFT_469548 [Linnemannia elongata]|nr:hypothetical protein BKA57DRAFT_469548 [Linnemannia elongata]